MVLGVAREVPAIARHRHLIEREPAVAGFAEVGDQRAALGGEGAEHGVHARIVDHDEAAVRVLQLHADVLPDLDGDGALRKAAGNRRQRGLRPVRLAPVLQVERDGPGDPGRMGPVRLLRRHDLPLEARPVHASRADREPLEVVPLQERHERGQPIQAGAADVRVRVDLRHLHDLVDGHEALPAGLGSGFARRPRGQNHQADGKHEEQEGAGGAQQSRHGILRPDSTRAIGRLRRRITRVKGSGLMTEGCGGCRRKCDRR